MQISRTIEINGRIMRLGPYEPEEPAGSAQAGWWRPADRERRSASVARQRPPGAGRFQIDEIDVSLDAGGLAMRTRVRGRNVAYVFAEVLLRDNDLGRCYGPVVREHIPAAGLRQTRGVVRPVWGDPVDVCVTLYPGLRVLTDVVESAFYFSVPERYDSSNRRLRGLYARAGGGAPFRAALTFDHEGELLGAVAYHERRGRSIPRAFIPKPGDQVSPFVEVLIPETGERAEDGGEWRVETALSTALTFGDEPFSVITEPLSPGDYVAGVVIQDLDGGLTRRYAL